MNKFIIHTDIIRLSKASRSFNQPNWLIIDSRWLSWSSISSNCKLWGLFVRFLSVEMSGNSKASKYPGGGVYSGGRSVDLSLLAVINDSLKNESLKIMSDIYSGGLSSVILLGNFKLYFFINWLFSIILYTCIRHSSNVNHPICLMIRIMTIFDSQTARPRGLLKLKFWNDSFYFPAWVVQDILHSKFMCQTWMKLARQTSSLTEIQKVAVQQFQHSTNIFLFV